MRQAFADTMLEVGQSDPNLVVLVGDISHGVLQPFAKACPGRYFNIGILEPTIVSMAAGLARSGLFPVAHTIAPFLIERSLEQIKLDFGYQNLGGTLISVGSAFDYAALGCSHHCYDDLAIVKAIPNTQVVYPAMPNELNVLFKQTYRNGSLTYFRLPGEKHGLPIDNSELKIGKAVRIREGKDITLIAAGPQLSTACRSINDLREKGIDADILYYPTYKPFDSDLLLASLNKTGRAVVIEEHSMFGGLGDEVLRHSANGGFEYSFINIPDRFSRGYGSYNDHCEALGFTVTNVVSTAENLIRG